MLVLFPRLVAVEEPKALFVVLPFPKNESANAEGGAPNVAPPKVLSPAARSYILTARLRSTRFVPGIL